MEPLQLLDGLEIKLRHLAVAADRQRADYERLEQENQQLKRALDRQTGTVTSLKDKLARRQNSPAPAAANSGEQQPQNGSSVDRETIEFCLREIDRCLDYLQRN